MALRVRLNHTGLVAETRPCHPSKSLVYSSHKIKQHNNNLIVFLYTLNPSLYTLSVAYIMVCYFHHCFTTADLKFINPLIILVINNPFRHRLVEKTQSVIPAVQKFSFYYSILFINTKN